jgi:hypothetical protein
MSNRDKGARALAFTAVFVVTTKKHEWKAKQSDNDV